VLQRTNTGAEDGWHTLTGVVETFTDAGPWVTDFRAFGGSPSSPTFEVEVAVTLIGSAGTIDLQFQGHENDTLSADFGGTWQIRSGTGAYANLRGAGTWSLSVDAATGERTFTCPGDVHFDWRELCG
jgi:hypothetical protein